MKVTIIYKDFRREKINDIRDVWQPRKAKEISFVRDGIIIASVKLNDIISILIGGDEE